MIVLFKPNGARVKDGVRYDQKLVNEHSFEHELENGWYLSIDDFPKPKKSKQVPKSQPKKKKKTSDPLSDLMG